MRRIIPLLLLAAGAALLLAGLRRPGSDARAGQRAGNVSGQSAIRPGVPGQSPIPQHVLIFAFDNTHLDDLQGIPSLWRFLQGGAFSTNHHTILPTRSAPGFAAIASGRYSERTGALDNSFFAGGQAQPGFAFWESSTPDGRPFGLEAPPWAAFNAAGLDVGAVGMSPIVLETGDDVKQFTTMANPDAPDPDAYRGVALYHADGTREFGAPNIPWMWPAVGGFPGWPLRAVEYPLTVTALMQERGIPVTFTYVENLHANRRPGTYDDVLARYDAAFSALFERLAADGITPDNSLFVFTTDEGDHLLPDGGRSVGIRAWLADSPTVSIRAASMQISGGAAADVYLDPGTNPEGAVAAIRDVPAVQAVAWGAGLRAVHMAVPAAPSRTPSFTVFADADAQFRAQGSKDITHGAAPTWNHGTLSPDIETVWLALRGPGIRPGPLDAWTDHTDILPTVQYLLGVPDAGLDGRIITEALTPEARPPAADDAFEQLGAVYKQVNAPLGRFGHAALAVSTRAARASDPAERARLDAALSGLVDQRDTLATEMLALLRAGAGNGQVSAGDEAASLAEGQALLGQIEALASG